MLKILNLIFVSASLYAVSDVQLSRKDISLAKDIASVHKDINRFKKINRRKVLSLKRRLKNTDIYDDYKLWVDRVYKISYVKNFKTFSACKDLNHNNDLNNPLIKYCRDKFIDLYSKSNDKNYRKHSKFFERNIKYYLFPLRRNFLTFLKNAQKHEEFKIYLSNLMTKTFRRVGVPIKPRILKTAYITEDMTSYVQKSGFINPKMKSFFKDEFLSEARSLREKEYVSNHSEQKVLSRMKALAKFYKNNNEMIDKSLAYKSFIVIGKKMIATDYYEAARFAFKNALDSSLEEEKDEATFFSLWPDLLHEKYREANKTIEEIDLHNSFEQHDSRLKFWIAYTMEKVGKEKLAGYYYEKIIEKDPISYYSVMSFKRLKKGPFKSRSIANEATVLKVNNEPQEIDSKFFSPKLVRLMKRLMAFSKSNYVNLVTREHKMIMNEPVRELIVKMNFSDDNSLRERLTLKTAQVLNKHNNYVSGFGIIYKAMKNQELNTNNELLKTLFPEPYINQITKISDEEIDPYIVLSLIRQESAFNPSARSSVGARGLMQMMPSTARTLQRKISSKALTNPSTNLKLGIKYFKKLFNKYDGNLVYTLSAYNAGESRVTRWQREYFKNRNILHMVESIPFDETNLYVKLIVRNLFFYKLISGHQEDSAESHIIFDVKLAKR